MKTSRQRILDYVLQKRRATSSEISRVFQMTPANARYHLEILEQERLLEAVNSKENIGKGRPTRVYFPSRKLTGHNLDVLTAAMLDIIRCGVGYEQKLVSLAESMCSRMEKPGNDEDVGSSSQSMTSRLNRLANDLNNYNYMVRWEARSGCPHIIIENCPYFAIIQEFPELCQLDSLLIENHLKVPVKQIQKLIVDKSGIEVCRFLVGV